MLFDFVFLYRVPSIYPEPSTLEWWRVYAASTYIATVVYRIRPGCVAQAMQLAPAVWPQCQNYLLSFENVELQFHVQFQK